MLSDKDFLHGCCKLFKGEDILVHLLTLCLAQYLKSCLCLLPGHCLPAPCSFFSAFFSWWSWTLSSFLLRQLMHLRFVSRGRWRAAVRERGFFLGFLCFSFCSYGSGQRAASCWRPSGAQPPVSAVDTPVSCCQVLPVLLWEAPWSTMVRAPVPRVPQPHLCPWSLNVVLQRRASRLFVPSLNTFLNLGGCNCSLHLLFSYLQRSLYPSL